MKKKEFLGRKNKKFVIYTGLQTHECFQNTQIKACEFGLIQNICSCPIHNSTSERKHKHKCNFTTWSLNHKECETNIYIFHRF